MAESQHGNAVEELIKIMAPGVIMLQAKIQKLFLFQRSVGQLPLPLRLRLLAFFFPVM
jgi:hypothetical protein